MGIFGGRRRLGGSRGREAREIPMAVGEQEVARAAVSFRPVSAHPAPGDLVVTTMRLVFTPAGTHATAGPISWVLDRPGATHHGAAVDRVDAAVRRHGFGRLADFDRVRPGRAATRSCPPTLVVTDMVGTETEIGILASRTSGNGNASNVGARDRMLGAITALLPQVH